jgi:nicotinamide mononucleotide transporter
MSDLLTEVRAIGGLEALALLTGIGYAILAVRHSRWCWLSGALSSGLLAVLAAQQRLPMQAIMQAVYVAFAVYGFWSWTAGATNAAKPAVTTWPLSRHLSALLLVALATLLTAPLLVVYTQAAWPRLDTAVMLGSFLATWMTAASKLENWPYWIVIDLASAVLYSAQGLKLAALLYLIYAVIAVIGWRSWWSRWRASRAPA